MVANPSDAAVLESMRASSDDKRIRNLTEQMLTSTVGLDPANARRVIDAAVAQASTTLDRPERAQAASAHARGKAVLDSYVNQRPGVLGSCVACQCAAAAPHAAVPIDTLARTLIEHLLTLVVPVAEASDVALRKELERSATIAESTCGSSPPCGDHEQCGGCRAADALRDAADGRTTDPIEMLGETTKTMVDTACDRHGAELSDAFTSEIARAEAWFETLARQTVESPPTPLP